MGEIPHLIGVITNDTLWCGDNTDHRLKITDMDFGQLLAFNKYHQASVIQFRTSVFTPFSIREKLKLVFERFSIQLEEGYIITVEDDRIRFRKLPI